MNDTDDPTPGSRWILILGLVLVVYVVVVGVWAASTPTDNVPVGEIDGQRVSQPVSCNAIVDSPPRDPDEPLPDPNVTYAERLGTAVAPATLSYTRPPCDLLHRDGRIVLGINAAVALVGAAGLIGWSVYRRRSRPVEESADATIDSATGAT